MWGHIPTFQIQHSKNIWGECEGMGGFQLIPGDITSPSNFKRWAFSSLGVTFYFFYAVFHGIVIFFWSF